MVAEQSVWATTVSPSPATGCDSAARNVCQMAVGALGNQLDQVASKSRLRGNTPGSWDLSSHFLPFLSDLSWGQRWEWRNGRDGETEARQRLFSADFLLSASPGDSAFSTFD